MMKGVLRYSNLKTGCNTTRTQSTEKIDGASNSGVAAEGNQALAVAASGLRDAFVVNHTNSIWR